MRLLAGLAAGPASELGPCAAAAYEAALRPFHGWATRALFAVVLAAAPYRATFERALGEPAASPPPPGAAASPAALVADERAFADAFAPLLADALAQLRALGQDDPTPV